MRRINSGEFAADGGRGARGGRGGRGEAPGAGRWIEGGKAYVVNEPGDNGMQSVRVDTATGTHTPMPAEPSYRPPQLDRALAGGLPSADGKKILFAINPHTVMIRKTASDYWVLDKSRQLLVQARRQIRPRVSCSPSSRPTAPGSPTSAICTGLQRPDQVESVRRGHSHGRRQTAHFRLERRHHQRHLRLGQRRGVRTR